MIARGTSCWLLILGLAAAIPTEAPEARPKAPKERTAEPSRKARPPIPARRGPAAAKRQAPDKPPRPRPDPLAGAWPDARRPQLGNGRPDSEIIVAALRLRDMRQGWDENRFLRHLVYVMDWARKSDLPDDGWTRTLLHRASSRGAIRKDRAARPGDMALFALEGATGHPSRVLAAVVVSRTDGGLDLVGPLQGGIQDLRMGLRKADPGDTALRTCPPPRATREAGASKGRKTRDRKESKEARSPPPAPCRTGDLFLGRVPFEALPGLFR